MTGIRAIQKENDLSRMLYRACGYGLTPLPLVFRGTVYEVYIVKLEFLVKVRFLSKFHICRREILRTPYNRWNSVVFSLVVVLSNCLEVPRNYTSRNSGAVVELELAADWLEKV